MEYEFKVNGRLVRVTPEQVIDAVRGVTPERVQSHAVRIDGTWYPAKQVFGIVFGLERADFNTETARRTFRRLGFPIRAKGRSGSGEDAEAKPSLKPSGDMIEILPAEEEYLGMPPILLEWSWWE